MKETPSNENDYCLMENPSFVEREFSSTRVFALKAESCWKCLWDRKHKGTSVIWDDIGEFLSGAGRRNLMSWGCCEAHMLLAHSWPGPIWAHEPFASSQ